jgi:hypothetical protein
MWKDEIVEEVRKNREAYAAKFNFDLQAMYEDLKKSGTDEQTRESFIQAQKTCKA